MYKLIAIDIDGTLLNSKGELTSRTISALKKASEQGVYVVLTSGRLTSSVKDFSEKIGADRFLIAENGASIISLETDEIIYRRCMSKDIVLKIVDMCLENNIFYMVYTDRELIVKDLKHMALFFYKQNYNPNARIEIHLAGKEYIESTNDNFTKVMICDEDRSIYNSIVNKFKMFKGIDVCSVPHLSEKELKFGTMTKTITYSYADISAKDVNKWTAIEELIRILDITPDEVIAIGDNINDISMIQNAGLGVAMENGIPSVKEVADFVTLSNDDDGVANVVEKFVLN